MTNEQIILNEAAKLDPATLHAIAAAHHTPEQIAAIAAKATTTDDDGNEKPASVADVEAVLAADELHTIAKWNSLNKRIRTGEKSLITCYLWKYTTKPSKEQREAAEAEGKEAAPAPHFYPTKSYLFSCLQVEDTKAAPAARFGSVAEIMAYNKKLAAERKAAKIDLDKLYTLYTAEYSRLYNSDDPDDEKAEQNAAKVFDDKSQNDPVFHALVDRMIQKMDDFISSDREAAAFVLALDKLNAPEQPAPAPAPAPVVIEERHELPELVHVDPLPIKKAAKKASKPTAPKSAKKPAATKSAPQKSAQPAPDALRTAQQAERKAKAAFLAVPDTDRKGQAAALDAWRKTRKAVEDAKSAPAAVAVLDEAPVKQLDFESIAAGLLA